MGTLKKIFGFIMGDVEMPESVSTQKPNEPVKSQDEELQKRTLIVEYEDVQVDVGRTTVNVLFEDGSKAKMTTVGDVYQSIDMGQDEGWDSYHHSMNKYKRPMREPDVKDVQIHTSLNKAQDYLRHVNGLMVVTVLDSSVNPSRAVTGKIKSATIGKTSKNVFTFRKAKTTPAETKSV